MHELLTAVSAIFSGPGLGDLATWFLGFATLALFVIGFRQIENERNSRVKQAREAEASRKRAQAELISVWIVREDLAPVALQRKSVMAPFLWVAVNNQSTKPVYQAVVRTFSVGQTGTHLPEDRPADQVCIPVVPPGRGYARVASPGGGMHHGPGVEIAFQDASGNCWARNVLGNLLELGVSTLQYCKVELPTNWEALAAQMPEEEVAPPAANAEDSSPGKADA